MQLTVVAKLWPRYATVIALTRFNQLGQQMVSQLQKTQTPQVEFPSSVLPVVCEKSNGPSYVVTGYRYFRGSPRFTWYEWCIFSAQLRPRY